MNAHLVGALGENVVVLVPIVGPLTPREAAEAGVWLQTIAQVVDPALDVDAIRREVLS